MTEKSDLKEKLRRIRILILDVDGVLTDGGVIYGNGDIEIKKFNIKDGLGIKLLIRSGITVAVITGRSSKALARRLHELGVSLIYDGVKDKIPALNEILEKTDAVFNETAFIGDDLPDIPVLKRAGLAVAVADAQDDVKRIAHMITEKPGGRGAVRETAEAILKAKGLWESIVFSYEEK